MASNPPSEPPSRSDTPIIGTQRFAPQAKSAEELLADQTVGLVALSDFRKRRADVHEAKERKAHDSLLGISRKTKENSQDISTPGTSDGESKIRSAGLEKKKRKAKGPPKLSFGGDDDEEEESSDQPVAKQPRKKLVANATSHPPPKALTKAAVLKEAATREALRKEFLLIQTAVKETPILIPFVFYDGTNIPGGICKVKKGDFIWVFLDRSRKVGAELGVGEKGERAARREWARVGVDDLMMVRGELIIPHHYDFYYFIINHTLGPKNTPLFSYSSQPTTSTPSQNPATPLDLTNYNPLQDPRNKSKSKSSTPNPGEEEEIERLEGFDSDPTFTKVVDRRWYEKNKHIYPASTWLDFDPKVDYQNLVKRDGGGNAFFFS